VVLRKKLVVEKGQLWLFQPDRYFFGSSPNRVGKRSPLRASKPLDSSGFVLLPGVRNPP
jgi:hypothetical protein